MKLYPTTRSHIFRAALVLGLTLQLAACGDNDTDDGPLPTATRTPVPTAIPPTSTPTNVGSTPTSVPFTPTSTPVDPTPTPTLAPLCPAGQTTGRCTEITPSANDQEAILAALIDAQPGDTIAFGAGTYRLTGQLSLDVDGVTLRGAGESRTVLDFSQQTSGAEGLLVTANDFTIEDMALINSDGDLLKILGSDGVYIRRVRAEWTGGPLASNGAYALYPVQCRNVLIEDCIVRGASDAGVYVGQSENIIVRRNLVEFNVAGIEIENSKDADVYNNHATHNTGGILIFNLPGLPVKDGRRTRIFDNDVVENNTANFAPPGNTVGAVPPGTGIMVMANDEVEVFDNDLTDNNTTHVLVISFNTAETLGGFTNNDPLYDPFSETIFVHDNRYTGGGTMPGGPGGTVLQLILGSPVPNVITDGDIDAAKLVDGQLPATLRLCVQEPTATTFANLDFANDGQNLTRDIGTVDCEHPNLPAVVIPGIDGAPTATPTPDTGGCNGVSGPCTEITPSANDQEAILSALIDAQPGDTIAFRAGTYHLTGQLSLDVDGVTLRGDGLDRTILNFSGQTSGAEGLLVTADDFIIEDLALEDSDGDLLKILGSDGVTIRRVRAEWTGGPLSTNGAYALYPVQCRNVLIEDCVVIGASDAGVYVGQSENIIVRRNDVQFNVAGIEIENSKDADVYENLATHNTGGILIFNLPGLPVKDGRRTRIFNNDVIDNNTPNFAPPGNIVGAVPTGTGIMIMANDEVEVFDNDLTNNNTAHVLLISYRTAATLGGFANNDPLYDPFSEALFIHDNRYIGGGTMPGGQAGVLLQLILGLPLPSVLTDGDLDPAKFVDGMLPANLRLCVQEPEGTTFANLDFRNDGENLTRDIATTDCTLPTLPPVSIPGVDEGTPTPTPAAL